MTKILWSSDIHLNLAKPKKIDEFCESVREKKGDILILTGDLSESDTLHNHLTFLSERINIPIYFCLGNHDYYKSSIDKVNEKLEKFLNKSPNKNLNWITKSGIVKLTERTCLIGGENWWDGGFGEINKQGLIHELIMLQDYRDIEDLSVGKDKRLKRVQEITDKFMKHFKELLPKAFEQFDEVILMTHVPPFKESCSYEASPLPEEWLFHFCCRTMGEYLLDTMKENKKKQLMVLSGHVHEQSFFKPLGNLTSIVASASYFKPKICTSIVIE